MVLISALGVSASATINLILIEWTRSALSRTDQGILPLPYITLVVFQYRSSMVGLAAIFLLAAAFSERLARINKCLPLLIVSLAVSTIIICNGVIAVACLAAWIPRIP